MWDNGVGGNVVVTGDPNWGKLQLNLNQIGHSDVQQVNPVGETKVFSITKNKYGIGSGVFTTYIRGSVMPFLQDDAIISWEVYVAPIARQWKFVQIKLVGN